MLIFGSFAATMDTALIDPSLLFPRLYADRTHAIYRHDLGRHMQVRPSDAADATLDVVKVPMLEDIGVQFVQDREKGFDFVTQNDRAGEEAWDDMALIQQSFRNLKDGPGEDMQLNILENGLIRLTSGGKYEASFLLLGNLWLKLEEDYGAQMYAAIPSHNLLLIGKEGDRNAILSLQETIRGVFFEADRATLLSKAIYQRFDGQWQIVATAF